MRILHLKNVAGVASTLAEAQKRLGHEAVVWSRGDVYGFPYDMLMPSEVVAWNVWMLKRWSELRTFDVLHIHGGIWLGEIFYPLFKKAVGTPIFVHHHGTETRSRGGMNWKSVVDGRFHSPPDLGVLLPDSKWIPIPVNVPPEPAPFIENEVPLFAHFTSSESNKGTSKVIKMFDKAFGPLRHTNCPPFDGTKVSYRGKDAELWVLSKIPHAIVESVMKRADVVFDQIAPWGIYGTISVEAMVLGRSTLATLDHCLYPPDCPVIYPRVPKLMELAYNESARTGYGALGRAYVERVHAADVVARKVLDAYERAR